MNKSSFVNPTYANVQKISIRSDFSDLLLIDVTLMVPSVSFTSSIDSETMYGVARFVDSVGLLEETPLRGEEQIIFEIADSSMINESGGIQAGAVSDPFLFTGFIYKIDNVTTTDINDSLIYDVHFVSHQSYVAGTKQLIRSFRDTTVSDIVKSIFEEYYRGPNHTTNENLKQVTVEETSGLIRCVIPRLRPEEAMSFLSRRSYSANQSPSCTFRFYESNKGYYFVSDEELFRLAELEEPKRIFQFTYLDAIPNTLDYYEEQMKNLESFENTDRINTLSDIYNGTYRNKVLELDILTRRTNLIDGSGQYDYFAERRRYFDVKRDETLIDRHTTRFIEGVHSDSETSGGEDTDIQKRFLVIKNFTSGEDLSADQSLSAETHYADIISHRQAYGNHIESTTVEAIGPGRFDVTAGDIIEMDIKRMQYATGSESDSSEQNKHLSGRYLVKTVSHVLEGDVMKNVYRLIKKDWSEVETISARREGPF